MITPILRAPFFQSSSRRTFSVSGVLVFLLRDLFSASFSFCRDCMRKLFPCSFLSPSACCSSVRLGVFWVSFFLSICSPSPAHLRRPVFLTVFFCRRRLSLFVRYQPSRAEYIMQTAVQAKRRHVVLISSTTQFCRHNGLLNSLKRSIGTFISPPRRDVAPHVVRGSQLRIQRHCRSAS